MTPPDFMQTHLDDLAEPRRLLLIDDDPTDCMSIRKITREFNCEWFVAGSIEAAVQTLSGKSSHYFAAIVLDLCVPSAGHGIAIFRMLAERYPEIPVVILSGHLDQESIQSICKIDFAFFAQKPNCFNADFFAKMFRFMDIPKRAKK